MAASLKNPPSNASLRHVSLPERRARLAVRHRLAPGTTADDARTVVRSLLALHATDPATVYLSVASRLRLPALDPLPEALLGERSIVRHHAMRRTLWVMEPDIARAAHASCTAALAVKEWKSMAKLLADNGVGNPEKWLVKATQRTIDVVEELGTVTARQLGATAPDLAVPLRLSVGKSYEGTQGAHTRLLQNLGFDGALVRTRSVGSWVSGEYEWAVARSWLPGGVVDGELTVREGAARLADAYLRSFGPVTSGDLQWWAGWSAGQARDALADVGAVPVTVEIDDERNIAPAWLHPQDLDVVEEVGPWATILPSLDPTMMGWKRRDWHVGRHGEFGDSLFDRNGNAGNSIWANGAVIGTWAHRKDTSVAFEYFDTATKKVRSMVDSSIDRYRATVGDTIVRPRYPAPRQANLLAG